MICGNQTATIQFKTTTENLIGERVETWVDAYNITGWLDLISGDSTGTYNAKIQESTHVFLADFDNLVAVTDNFLWDDFNFTKDYIVEEPSDSPTIRLTSDNCRMIVNDTIYSVQLIDDPMGMHRQLEIYLKYLGGGLGV